MKDSDKISFFSEFIKNEEVVEYLLETASVGIALLDSGGYYIRVNPKFARSIGYTVEEVEGMHYSDISCPLFIVSDAYKYSKIVSGKIESVSIRKRYFKRNGDTLDARVDIFSLYSEETGSRQFIGFYRNSKPFYNEYLPMLHPCLKHLVDNDPSPGILIAAQDGEILFGSSFASMRLGYAEYELDNMSVTDILDLDHTRMLMSLIHSNASCKVLECELEFYHRDGDRIRIPSQVYVDDTNSFRYGRMLVIVFTEESGNLCPHKKNDRGLWERELLLEVRQIRKSLHLCCNAALPDGSTVSDIRLSDYELTAREREVLLCFLERKNTKEIAFELDLAEITIRKHFTSLYRKFGVSSREDLLLMLHGKSIA